MKHMRMLVLGFGLAVLFCGEPVTGHAFDVGGPVYGKDLQGSLGLELIVEHFDREVKISFDTLGKKETEGLNETVLMGRFHLSLGKDALLYVDAGLIDDDDAESTPLVIGLGADILVYEQQKLRLNVVAAGHWVPSFDLEEKTRYHFLHTSGEEEYYELGAGMLVSGNLPFDRQTKVVPYGGIMFSMLRGSVDVDAHYGPVKHHGSADIEEDNPLVAVAGISLLFQKGFSFRMEARFIGDSSLSVGLGIAF